MPRSHYALVSSLPWLPPFEQVKHVPMSNKQLLGRLKMLDHRDAVELEDAQALVRWQWHPISRTSADVHDDYREFVARAHQPGLRQYVDFRLGQRTAVAALRLRRRGLDEAPDPTTWAIGPLTRRIASHWTAEDLGLRYVFPWIESARAALEDGNAVEFERVLMHASWQHLSALEDTAPFGFEAVVAFTFKLDIIQRWLSFDPHAAKARFRSLVQEVTRDHQQLFS